MSIIERIKKRIKKKHKKRNKKKFNLPDEIIVVPNPDKKFHERWYEGRRKMNIPHPFRAVLLGPPNRGKTLLGKNLLWHAYPNFERLVIIHYDPDYTKEYDDMGEVEILKKIPPPSFWDGKRKTLCILDDLDFKSLGKSQRKALNRLFGFVSTHKNVSCVLCAQDPFNVPASVRRCANLWVLWKMEDVDALATCARKTGVKRDLFMQVFDRHLINTHDSFWIDNTEKSPYKLRINGKFILAKAPKFRNLAMKKKKRSDFGLEDMPIQGKRTISMQ